MRLRHVTLAATVAIFLLAARGSSGEPVDVFDSQSWPDPRQVTVPPQAMAFSTGRYGYDKSDTVYFVCRFEGGTILILSMAFSDTFLFNRWAIYVLVAEPSGSEHVYTVEIPRNAVKTQADRLFVSDGKNTIEGDGGTFRVRFDINGFSCDLRWRNLLQPWWAGSGRNTLSADGSAFEDRVITSPWAEVQGSLSFAGKSMQVTGQGYGEKTLLVSPLTRLNPLLLSLRLYSDDGTPAGDRWHLGIIETVSHKEYGGKRVPVLLLAHGGAWVFATHAYTLSTQDERSYAASPFTYPGRLVIRARQDGYALEGVFVSRRVFDYTDTLERVPSLLRPIAGLLVRRPVFFRTVGDFTGSLAAPDGRVAQLRLSGPYEYVTVR